MKKNSFYLSYTLPSFFREQVIDDLPFGGIQVNNVEQFSQPQPTMEGVIEPLVEPEIQTHEQNAIELGGKYCKWTDAAMQCLVDAKLVELARLQNKSDTKFHMLRAQQKWEIISAHLKNEGFDYKWTRCRDKWSAEGTIYKKLSD